MGCWGPSSWTTQKKNTGSWVNSFQASSTRGAEGHRVGCPNEPFQLCFGAHSGSGPRVGLVGRVAPFWCFQNGGRVPTICGVGWGINFPPNQQLYDSRGISCWRWWLLPGQNSFSEGRVVENQIFVAVFGILVGNLYQKCRGWKESERTCHPKTNMTIEKQP